MAAGQLADASAAVETALALAAQTGQPFFDAELHRLQGEVVLQLRDHRGSLGEHPRAAVDCLLRALDVARAQETGASSARASVCWPGRCQSRARLVAARSSKDFAYLGGSRAEVCPPPVR